MATRTAIFPMLLLLLVAPALAQGPRGGLTGMRDGEPQPADQRAYWKQQAASLKARMTFVAEDKRRSSPSKILSLLASPWVAEEMNLTDSQRAAIGHLQEVAKSARYRLLRRKAEIIPALPPARWGPTEALADARIRRCIERTEALAIHGILDSEQSARFRQLRWRREGVHALGEDPEVAEALKLSRPQREFLHQRYSEFESLRLQPPPELARNLTLSHRLDPDSAIGHQAMSDIKMLNRVNEERVWSVLSPTQRRRWEGLLGKPPGPSHARTGSDGDDPSGRNGGDSQTDGGAGKLVIPPGLSPAFDALLGRTSVDGLRLTDEVRREIDGVATVASMSLKLPRGLAAEGPSADEAAARRKQIVEKAEALAWSLLDAPQRDAVQQAIRAR